MPGSRSGSVSKFTPTADVRGLLRLGQSSSPSAVHAVGEECLYSVKAPASPAQAAAAGGRFAPVLAATIRKLRQLD